MIKPPNILFTGINGVGKSTILNIFPGEIILELDNDFNEIIQKTIEINKLKHYKTCILREIDLNELVKKFNSFHSLLQTIEIICLVVDSTERNIIESQELMLKFKEKLPDARFFIIANFQDRSSISWSIEKIENYFNLKTFSFSAIQDDSEVIINKFIKEILNLSFPKNRMQHKTPISNKDYDLIWFEFEEARLLEAKQEYLNAAEKFSNIALKLKNLDSKNEEIKALYYMCKAWESLDLGEESKNIQKFAEAEILFNQANENLSDSNLKNLVYSNSIFCEMLKLGLQFDDSEMPNRIKKYYPKIQSLIKRVIELYNNGGFIKEAEWAKMTLKKLEN